MTTVTAIVLDENHLQLLDALHLPKGSRMLLAVLDEGTEEAKEVAEAGMRLLNRAYDESEPEYTTEMVREPNPDYSG